jgi:hypothetical protein
VLRWADTNPAGFATPQPDDRRHDRRIADPLDLSMPVMIAVPISALLIDSRADPTRDRFWSAADDDATSAGLAQSPGR